MGLPSFVVNNDSGLSDLLGGRLIRSDVSPDVAYRLVEPLGEGGMSVAFYALRETPRSVTPAVLKVVRPEIVGSAGPTALLMIRKEAIALGRLNERIPPTPFVIRFLDTGALVVPGIGHIELPWIAVEYVHGGAEGTTLLQRVGYSVKNTHFAFDPARAVHAIECLAEGLSAIHEVGVVHRDLTPGNVLCCGFGSSEVLKIADFGIARPTGIQATFGSVMLGTPGYAPPEQSFSSEGQIGPWTDVFSFACLAYFVLTGEQYFDTPNFAHALMMVRDAKRRSILEGSALCPELRENPSLARSIDFVLAHATTVNPNERPRDARVFASSLVQWIRGAAGPRSQRSAERLVASVASSKKYQTLSGWTWTTRHPPGDDRLVRSVAWDGDGHGLAITTDGLQYWNGSGWLSARIAGVPAQVTLRCATLVRSGLFLVSGDHGFLALLGTDGSYRILPSLPNADFSLLSGDPEDLAVFVGERPNGTPELHSVAARHFFRPVPLPTARTVASLCRIDDTRWLVAGRTLESAGFAAIYSALAFEVTALPLPPSSALTASAGHVDRGFGVAAGRNGATVRYDGARSTAAIVEGAPDLASAAMDVQGRAWVGGTGFLWSQTSEPRATWLRAWEDSAWTAPFVALHADIGVITAMTVDGAVLEGRTAAARHSSPSTLR
jgi:serine/threonine protein kinase